MPTPQPPPARPRTGRDGARPRDAVTSASPALSASSTPPAHTWHESIPLRRIIDGVSTRNWTLSLVTPTGWACLALLLVTGLAALRLGWQEAWSAAAVLAVVVGTSWLWLLPRGAHHVSHELLEPRVTVGDEAIIHLTVLNPTGRPLLPARMEMPVGPGTAVFAVPTLRPAAIHERGFVLPTARRSIVTVGPVVSVSADPIGLLRHERTRTRAQLVHIHPRTVRVGSSLHGLMRDVEGAITQELSSSDVSFHALREYVPGDDRRNVHWRTTAHTGRLMVRQFEETHRSSLLILLDCLIEDYEVEEDFETAVSVACSLALDAISDGREATLVTQEEELPTATGLRLLDASCSVTPTARQGCDDLARQASSRHPEASVIILVTGQHCAERTLAHVRTLTPLDAVVLALRCGSNAMGRHSAGGLTAYDLDRIESLPRIMRKAS